jgi:hypothetical protein
VIPAALAAAALVAALPTAGPPKLSAAVKAWLAKPRPGRPKVPAPPVLGLENATKGPASVRAGTRGYLATSPDYRPLTLEVVRTLDDGRVEFRLLSPRVDLFIWADADPVGLKPGQQFRSEDLWQVKGAERYLSPGGGGVRTALVLERVRLRPVRK